MDLLNLQKVSLTSHVRPYVCSSLSKMRKRFFFFYIKVRLLLLDFSLEPISRTFTTSIVIWAAGRSLSRITMIWTSPLILTSQACRKWPRLLTRTVREVWVLLVTSIYYTQGLPTIVTPPTVAYKERLVMPKLMVCTGGDEFFQNDDSWYFWDDLPGEKFIR